MEPSNIKLFLSLILILVHSGAQNQFSHLVRLTTRNFVIKLGHITGVYKSYKDARSRINGICKGKSDLIGYERKPIGD